MMLNDILMKDISMKFERKRRDHKLYSDFIRCKLDN